MVLPELGSSEIVRRKNVTFVAFKKIHAQQGSAVRYRLMEEVDGSTGEICLSRSDSFNFIHQLLFSGWKLGEGLTEFHKSRIAKQIRTTGGEVSEIFLAIGIDDIRLDSIFVFFSSCNWKLL
jgi:sulfate adenylyltransferase subunit 1 (EFTu-like GTPase family)